MFGYFFTSYDDVNERYLKTVKRKKGGSRRGRVCRGVAGLIERSFFVNAAPKITELLLRLTLKDYGIMTFVMGALIAVLYFLNDYVTFLNVSIEMFISGMAVCACAVPMLFSSKSLSHNVYSSKLCNRLLFKFLGLNKEKMREASEKDKISIPNGAIFLGIALGVFACFIPPLQLVALIGFAVLCYCTLRTPEIGIIAVILSLPFASISFICGLVTYVFICYVIKCLIGKRTFKFEYFDIFVILVFAVTLIRGAISPDYIQSLKNALVSSSLILFYFVVTNLIRSKAWFRRCLLAFVISGSIVSTIAIVQIVIGKLSLYFPDLSRLFTNGQSATSLFSDSEVLAHFLVSIIPFTLVHLISERIYSKKFIGALTGLLLLAAMAFTHSISGIVGLVFATLLLLTIYNRNFAYLSLVVIAVCPVLYFTLPAKALEKLLSMKMLEGLTVSGFVENLRNGFKMVLANPLGIGSSENYFKELFGVSYGYFDNLLIQALIEYGVVGLVIFSAFALMLIRLTFSYCIKAKNQYRKINCCAGFCSLTGLVISCMLSYTWHDKGIYLLFWILVALSFAYIRIERQDEEPKGALKDFTSATLEITLTGDSYHDNVPVRRYVRAHRSMLDMDDLELEIKEFEETSGNLTAVKEFEEAENQEYGETE